MPKPLGALVRRGDAGDVGGGDGHIGAGDAGHCTPYDEDPTERSERHDEIIKQRAGQRQQQDRPATETIAQRAENGREDELHHGINGEHGAIEEINVAPGGQLGQQVGEDREDETGADGIDADGCENDDQALVHDGLQRYFIGDKPIYR